MENDVGVSLVNQDEEEDEDLLEYDDENEEVADTNDMNSVVNVVSEDEVRRAAEVLLQRDSPKVLVHYGEDYFFLFDCNSEHERDEEQDVVPIIIEDSTQIHHSCSEMFIPIRRFLESFYGKLLFMSKEILFEIPSLDIELCEDNVYNSQMSFNDIYTIFNILKERSEAQTESDVPPFLEAYITTRMRFVSRYNALVELAQSSATFKNIRPFTNDKTHPLILDDNVLPTADRQIVIMNVDEEHEPNPDKGHDSDELLEIVENESEGNFSDS